MSTSSTAQRDREARNAAQAEALGLRYVHDGEPGYTRLRWGRGFTYRDAGGETVRNPDLRARFEKLAIPPAWTEVWICIDEVGHILATGRDDAGRKQYIYHPRWSEGRKRAKFARVIELGRMLPEIRVAVGRDLERPELCRERVAAALVRLLETTLARVGNEAYARANHSYGLTTLRRRHVEARDEEVLTFEFRGKHAKPWDITIEDPQVIRVVHECLELPGPRVFEYLDEAGEVRPLEARDVNEYLRSIGDARLSAKDFRTWAGTVLAAEALWETQHEAPELPRHKQIVAAVRATAEELNNTPALCRSAYVHPCLIEGFERGSLGLAGRAEPPNEEALLRLLEQASPADEA